MRAPSELNFSGYFRNSTTSCSSALASSTPATSENVTTVLLPRNMRARLLPKLMAWLLVPWACRIMKKMKPPIRRTGSSTLMRSPSRSPACEACCGTTCTSRQFPTAPDSAQVARMSDIRLSPSVPGTWLVFCVFAESLRVICSCVPCSMTWSIWPALMSPRKESEPPL